MCPSSLRYVSVTGPLGASVILSRDEYAQLPEAAVFRTRAVPVTRLELVRQCSTHKEMSR